jgi:hypothetical protein
MGIVLEYEGAGNLQEQVFATAKKELPLFAYRQLTDTSDNFRRGVFHSSVAFNQQLPFYAVKPLYTRLIQLFYKAGIPLAKATVVPSLIAYFLLGMVLFYWLQKYLPLMIAGICASTIALWSPILMLSRTSTPDALSVLLITSSLYCIIEKRNAAVMYFLLLLSILARPDNILPAIFFISVDVYDKNHEWKQRAKIGTLMLAGCLTCYFFVSALATKYGWGNFLYADFYQRLNPAYDMNLPFSMNGYLALVKSQLMTGLYYSQLPLFFFLSVTWIAFHRKVEFGTMLIAAIWAIIIIRFVLHPMVADRIYISYYLVILMIILQGLMLAYKERAE